MTAPFLRNYERQYVKAMLNTGAAQTPEEDLFIAVIVQAILDTGLAGRKGEQAHAKRDAESWLTQRPAAFHFVCDMAGLHPDTVTAALAAYRERGTWHDGVPRKKRVRRLTGARGPRGD